MFRLQIVLRGSNRFSILLLTGTYWGSLLIMAPVTVFALGAPINVDPLISKAEGYRPFSMMWLGIVIFWAINLIAILVTYCIKSEKTTAKNWYKKVLFYGAYELADMVANKSDELRNREKNRPEPWWKQIFVFWWAFSIKYFIPWALFNLMMWNFKSDIDLKLTKDGVYRGYGKYNDMWQVVGFIYPLIGLLCFVIPVCIVTTPEQDLHNVRDQNGKLWERKEIELDIEEDDRHRKAEEAYVDGLISARNALLAMKHAETNRI